MTENILGLIEQYGLVAVFLGCVAEGETAAMIGGFFAHQAIFPLWSASLAVFLGAFLGDVCFFTAGRKFADRPVVARIREKPGFSHAFDLVNRHPDLFVLGNRYLYGLRLAGGVAAGLSSIPVGRFVVLNAISSLIWTAIFVALGYFLGLGAEELIGRTLLAHHKLLIALAVIVAGALAGFLLLRRRRKAA